MVHRFGERPDLGPDSIYTHPGVRALVHLPAAANIWIGRDLDGVDSGRVPCHHPHPCPYPSLSQKVRVLGYDDDTPEDTMTGGITAQW